jgi:copper chaperone
MFMTHKNVHVEGMTCGHCVETVTKAVNSLNGISRVSVDLDKKQVSVDFDESRTDLDTISSKIIEVGFEVVSN